MAQKKIQSVQLSDSGVVPGLYTSANVTVDVAGRITAIANGTGGAISEPLNQIVFGTGPGVDSDINLIYSSVTGELRINSDGMMQKTVASPANIGILACNTDELTGPGNPAGSIYMVAGSAVSGIGGVIQIVAGSSENNLPGSVYVNAGSCTNGGYNGGGIDLNSGNGMPLNGGGGEIRISTGGGTLGGSISLSTGDGDTEYGGDISLSAGNGPVGGGNISMLAGNSTDINEPAGNVTIISGRQTGVASGGKIEFGVGGRFGARPLTILPTGAFEFSDGITPSAGTAGQVLTSNSDTAVPTWQDPPVPAPPGTPVAIGDPSDVPGKMKSDTNFLYVCIAPYDGVSAIWKRVGLIPLSPILEFTYYNDFSARNGFDGDVGIAGYIGPSNPFVTPFSVGTGNLQSGDITSFDALTVPQSQDDGMGAGNPGDPVNSVGPMAVGLQTFNLGPNNFFNRHYYFPMTATDSIWVVGTSFPAYGAGFTIDVVVGPTDLSGEKYICTGNNTTDPDGTISIERVVWAGDR